MSMSFEEKELYGELLSFLTVYLVDLSSKDNLHLPSRTLFSPTIKGHTISHTGLSNWDWMSGLLIELKIAKTDASGLSTVCQNGEDIKAQFSAVPRPDILTLEYMLEEFVVLCGSYGPAIDFALASVPFQIRDGQENLFNTFVKYEYVTKAQQGYSWTDKIGPAMVRNSTWSSYSVAIQRQLETETDIDQANRLQLMYETMPKAIRTFIMESEDRFSIAEKLRLNWNWNKNVWNGDNADLVTWAIYSEYTSRLQELVSAKV